MRKPLISTPAHQDSRLKVLLHAPSGVGKTRFASTFPTPIFLDFEEGSSSISIPVDVVPPAEFQVQGKYDPARLIGVLEWLASDDAKKYETVVIDSITELQEQFINSIKKPDPRQVYGEWASHVRDVMSRLRSFKKHVVILARTKTGDTPEGVESLLIPEISPAAWKNVPPLVDYGLFMKRVTEGFGPGAKSTPVLITSASGVWTKTRALLPVELKDPTYDKLVYAIATSRSEAAALHQLEYNSARAVAAPTSLPSA